MIKGFSTGALARGDFQQAITLLEQSSANAIELSAIREDEVKNLINSIDSLNLQKFDYVSFHAPSKLYSISEEELINMLEPIVQRGWPIITHPDIMSNYENWIKLGNCLCIENMDKRKNIGRTAFDLDQIFYKLPMASFCFDIAHARQVDPTMTEAYCMITKFKSRLREIHISTVNTQSKHEPLTYESLLSFRKLSEFIPDDIPLILESPVTPDRIELEMNLATSILLQQHNIPLHEELESVLKISNMSKKEFFIEKRDDGEFAIRKPNSQRASDILPTQKEAIERAKDLDPNATIHLARVRHTEGGNPDKWRKA